MPKNPQVQFLARFIATIEDDPDNANAEFQLNTAVRITSRIVAASGRSKKSKGINASSIGLLRMKAKTAKANPFFPTMIHGERVEKRIP